MSDLHTHSWGNDSRFKRFTRFRRFKRFKRFRRFRGFRGLPETVSSANLPEPLEPLEPPEPLECVVSRVGKRSKRRLFGVAPEWYFGGPSTQQGAGRRWPDHPPRCRAGIPFDCLLAGDSTGRQKTRDRVGQRYWATRFGHEATKNPLRGSRRCSKERLNARFDSAGARPRRHVARDGQPYEDQP
jgi:hypothetical protein